ncbi:glucosamine-6-phosphate deaminase NagB-II [Neptunicella marina]|uniref:SIS domain-containing protein n=1 Tax=Neptunicella marina TaxID=2125989 RepID=A0A8J6LXN5_9ALTE|nr:SIS domain-containing protein [Neptunicella marina]MBC3765714.1 SIS domain-containing protein [Neptunicella marina]
MATSIMAKEAAEAPSIIATQLVKNLPLCRDLGEKIRAFNPAFVYMVGRGSSDHAGVFAKYLIEVEANIPVCAAAPSVNSVYKQTLNLKSALVICISQSGRSPDILAQTKAAKDSGAFTVALVNDQASPLAEMADFVLPIGANEEKAVAATKSYLATLSALLQMVACWQQDDELLTALNDLPSAMEKAATAPMQLNADFVAPLNHCVVLGRGFGYAISREIALKLKEVCSVHAEAFSSAEFLHGPVTLVEKKLAIVDISVKDESLTSHQEQIDEVTRRGARVCKLDQSNIAIHPRLSPLLILQRFYLDIEQIAVGMGLDPDSPAGLKKVTQTI